MHLPACLAWCLLSFIVSGKVYVACSTIDTLLLLASGTPIQNDLSEFHAVFDVALPGLLGDLNNFRKQYEYPILKGRDADATSEQVQASA
jgi:SNF2 family DNA or RNA helicase